MRAILSDVQAGKFSKNFLDDVANQSKIIKSGRALDVAHPIESAGKDVRAMLPWLKTTT